MAGLEVKSFYLTEKRIETTDDASFVLVVRNTFEELDILNVNVKASIGFPEGVWSESPFGLGPNLSVQVTGINAVSTDRISPSGERTYNISIATMSAVAGKYELGLSFGYDLSPTTSLPKSSSDTGPFTIVPD